MKATKMFASKTASSLLTVIAVMVLSCQKDTEILNSVDTQNVNSEAASSAYVNENSDISSIAISNLTMEQYAGARVSGEFVTGLGGYDGRLKCAIVSVTRTGTKLAPAGTITINYDSLKGCVDDHNVTRKGKIIITYSGRRWQPGSTFTIQLVNFYRNSVHIEGAESNSTQLSVDSLHLQFSCSLTGGKITFSDGRTIEREHNFTKTWYRSSDPTQPANDEWHIEGGASGKNKNGNLYSMQIGIPSTTDPTVLLPAPLIVKFNCWTKNRIFIPVKGIKIIAVTSATETRTYKVDYGDGACDNLVIVTINGKEKIIPVSGDGN